MASWAAASSAGRQRRSSAAPTNRSSRQVAQRTTLTAAPVIPKPARIMATAAATTLTAIPAHAAPATTTVAAECDRACLTRAMDDYLAALVRHDASALPLHRDARYTEWIDLVAVPTKTA